jgi:hypothetical protein
MTRQNTKTPLYKKGGPHADAFKQRRLSTHAVARASLVRLEFGPHE